jgi:hypothetical protein
VQARRLFWIMFALFLLSVGTVLVGFPTCNTEAGTCPKWHETLNLVAFLGTGACLLAVLILA